MSDEVSLSDLSPQQQECVMAATNYLGVIARAKGNQTSISVGEEHKATPVSGEAIRDLRAAEQAFNTVIKTSFGGAGYTEQSFRQRRDAAMAAANTILGF